MWCIQRILSRSLWVDKCRCLTHVFFVCCVQTSTRPRSSTHVVKVTPELRYLHSWTTSESLRFSTLSLTDNSPKDGKKEVERLPLSETFMYTGTKSSVSLCATLIPDLRVGIHRSHRCHVNVCRSLMKDTCFVIRRTSLSTLHLISPGLLHFRV